MAQPQNLCDEALSAFVTELLGSVHDQVAHLRHPPGRKPSVLSQQLAEVMKKLSDAEASSLIRHVTDAALFRVCYLLENDFNHSQIEVVFRRGDQSCLPAQSHLHEKYRMLVDPGGLIAD